MSQKLTLARYLEGRGTVKALTRIEAEAFGIDWPLVSGWARRHGALEITAAMLGELEVRIGTAKQSTASKALCGLNGIAGSTLPMKAPALHAEAPLFPGFALRLARRYRAIDA